MNCWIELDAQALLHNYRTFGGLLGNAQIVPVIKSNAYGHGLKEVFEILKREKPAWLGVAYLDEARALRQYGFEGRILLVAPVLEEDFAEARELSAEILVGHWSLIERWLGAANKPDIHIKIDTGLSRQGFLPTDAAGVAERLRAHEPYVAGICTHFANAEDESQGRFAALQLSRLQRTVEAFEKQGLKPLAHAASSTSSLIVDESRFGLGRIGISLYGFWPSRWTQRTYSQQHSDSLDLQPVLSWKTTITTLKEISAGEHVGYGCTYRADKNMTIAVLPVGYAEGYPRLAGEHGAYVLVRGQRCLLIGRISMNLMTIDVDHLHDVAYGDTVTLIGNDGAETIPAETLADWAQAIHYETVTQLSPAIPRRIVWTKPQPDHC